MFSQVTTYHEVMPYFLIANINQRVWDELVDLIYLLFRQLNGALWNKKHLTSPSGSMPYKEMLSTSMSLIPLCTISECQNARLPKVKHYTHGA